nr:DNA helicase MCM9 [Hydra vulgaris]
MSKLDTSEAQKIFETFLEKYHEEDVLRILLSTNKTEHFSIIVNAFEMFDANMDISYQFLKNPSLLLPTFDSAVCSVQLQVMSKYGTLNKTSMSIKNNCHIRVTNLPICPELSRDHLPKCEDVGSFLSVKGTVIRCTLTKLLEYQRQYICNKCHHVFDLSAEFEQNYTIPLPTLCPSPESCNSKKFTALTKTKKCKDYQEIKIQEQVQNLHFGHIPRSIWVLLEDDLVDSCKPGDDVTITGIVLQRWKSLYKDNKCDVELVLKANHVVIDNIQHCSSSMNDQHQKEFHEFWSLYQSSPLRGRNEILRSFCPQVYGLYLVKLTVALVLVGGVQRLKKSGTKIRGESHLLLVGDPGTGKSQFLKYATKLMKRSVLTTGVGSTNAGLTVTAVKDCGEWHLEAGALVLADGGVCCIDEFNSIRDNDRASIHEAMEQQTISVAKAGMVCKLNTRTTIIAATNSKGKYDPDLSLSANIALASPLLSRFDVILVLKDNQNKEWDKYLSNRILTNKLSLREVDASNSCWNIEQLQTYFAYVKTLTPELSKDCCSILQTYYQAQRAAATHTAAAQTTIRLLESLIRLSEAHARLMFHNEVTIQDAIVAVCIIENSMQNMSLLGGFDFLHVCFPEDPDKEYFESAKLILEKLNLHTILAKVIEKEEIRLKDKGVVGSCTDFESEQQKIDNTPIKSSEKIDNTCTPIKSSEKIDNTCTPIKSSEKIDNTCTPIKNSEKIDNTCTPIKSSEKIDNTCTPIKNSEKIDNTCTPIKNSEKNKSKIKNELLEKCHLNDDAYPLDICMLNSNLSAKNDVEDQLSEKCIDNSSKNFI